MNLMMQQGRLFVQRTLCKTCAMQMARRCLVTPQTAKVLPWRLNNIQRGYHNIRLETISEVWQQFKKEFKYLKRASANRPLDPKDLNLGLEIGTAVFLIKANARVHFSNGRWYGRQQKGERKVRLPAEEAVGYTVNAIDASGTLIDQNGFRDVMKLTGVKYLNIEGCPHIDDTCLAHLVHIRDSLTHLNINKCPSVTENGVATLHKLRKLERLNMSDLPKVRYSKLIASMLEDAVPRLRVNIISNLVDTEENRAKENFTEEDLGQTRTESV
ncbi:putative ATP synthase subunit s-like protein [Apostichopus japonicus]|uniref:Putative ATP synthase subunit s-like protein n=1 Tax=Stichopus japonicus TaxID=307972 RepID=A0A2G8L7X8_STIJA|nr:putative ATP synthase subunit s-like protein [Apostichopus japonicus]